MSSLPILITGAAGFIGARFAQSCLQKGWPVVSVDEAKFFNARPEHAEITYTLGDSRIVDRDELFTYFKKDPTRYRAIVHLGACADTTETDEAYLKRVNVEYSQKLWAYATEQKIPFVYASSAATYGSGIGAQEGPDGYDDDERQIAELEPLNAYGRSKQAVDVWALAQERAGHAPPSWSGFKFFNVYGYGERHKGKMASVVLHAFDQIQKSGQMRLFESHRSDIAHGYQKRDFVFIDDVVNVLHFAIQKPIPRGIYNLGTGTARPFLDLGRAVFAALGRPEQIEFIPTPVEIRDKYQYYTEAKMDRLRAAGYTAPFTSLENGVREYIRQLEQGA